MTPVAISPAASSAPNTLPSPPGISDAGWSDAMAQAQGDTQTQTATQPQNKAAFDAPDSKPATKHSRLADGQDENTSATPATTGAKPHEKSRDARSEKATETAEKHVSTAGPAAFAAMLMNMPNAPAAEAVPLKKNSQAAETSTAPGYANATHEAASVSSNATQTEELAGDTTGATSAKAPNQTQSAKISVAGQKPAASEGAASSVSAASTAAQPAVSSNPPPSTGADTNAAVHTATSHAPAPAAATTSAVLRAQTGSHAPRSSEAENLTVASAVPAAASTTATAAQPGPMLVATATATPAPVSAATPVQPATPGASGSVAATPSALAAAVTAMHHAGQASTTLRLDPAGLGSLSVHVALGAGGQVNVLFVPATAQTAQLLNAGMGELRHAMAASGLNLGQAQVGGQAGGQGGQNQSGSQRQGASATNLTAPAEPTQDNGVRAYA